MPNKRVILKIIPKTQNQLLGMHWRSRMRERDRLHAAIDKAMGPYRFGDTQGKQRVRIVMHRIRLQDPDNKVASVKYLIDALRRLGWLVDDTPEFLELEVEEYRAGHKANVRTEITIEPVSYDH